MNRASNIFEKGNSLLSTVLFKVSKVLDTKHVTHCLRDMKDEDLLDFFQDYELPKAKYNGIYQTEKILKSRTYWGKRQLLFRWLGYSSDLDS